MNQIAERLEKDHQELDSLLLQLAQDAAAPCPGVLEPTWNAFERRVLKHMAAEERFLLPLVEASDPAEVERTRIEHTQIRGTIAKLGVAIELHTVRATDINQLIELLRAHAKHEDERLYKMAGDGASAAVARSVFETLKNSLTTGPRAQRDLGRDSA